MIWSMNRAYSYSKEKGEKYSGTREVNVVKNAAKKAGS